MNEVRSDRVRCEMCGHYGVALNDIAVGIDLEGKVRMWLCLECRNIARQVLRETLTSARAVAEFIRGLGPGYDADTDSDLVGLLPLFQMIVTESEIRTEGGTQILMVPVPLGLVAIFEGAAFFYRREPHDDIELFWKHAPSEKFSIDS
jgi:hypothetical protein